MKNLTEVINFLESHPKITSDSKEVYASQILNLDNKTRKDVLYVLETGGFGELSHITDLIKICRENNFKIKKISEEQIVAYCNKDITAEKLISDIQKQDLERLVPKYRDPPCKIDPKAAEKLRGK